MEFLTFHPEALEEIGELFVRASGRDRWRIRTDLKLLSAFGESFVALVNVEGDIAELWMEEKELHILVLQRRGDGSLCGLSACRPGMTDDEHERALKRARQRRYP